MRSPDAVQRLKIAAKAEVDTRTVQRIYEGKTSKPAIRARVVEAAKKLKMPEPPKDNQ